MKTLYQTLYENETIPPKLNVKRYKEDLDLTDLQNIYRLEKLQVVMGDLTNKIVETPNLIYVSGNLNLENSQIQELPNLREVGRDLDLEYSEVQELPNLVEVGGNLILNSQIQELPNLVEVGEEIWVEYKKLDYWKDYFMDTGRPHLSEKAIAQ